MSRRLFEVVRCPMLSDGPEHDEHREAIEALDLECLPEVEQHPGYWAMNSAPAQWWLVREKRSPRLGPRWVAYTGCIVNPGIPWAYLSRMGVAACARGHGLQRRLGRVAVAWAKQSSGCEILVSDTTHNPISSNNLYAIGMRMFEPDWAWAFPESNYWRLDLA